MVLYQEHTLVREDTSGEMPRYLVTATAEMVVMADNEEEVEKFINSLIDEEQWTLGDAELEITLYE